MGNSCSQYVVERRNAVGGNEKQMVAAYLVDVAYLATGKQLQVTKVSL